MESKIYPFPAYTVFIFYPPSQKVTPACRNALLCAGTLERPSASACRIAL